MRRKPGGHDDAHRDRSLRGHDTQFGHAYTDPRTLPRKLARAAAAACTALHENVH
jgi:hypothetical protein